MCMCDKKQWTSLFTTTDGSNYNVFTIQTMREKKKKKNNTKPEIIFRLLSSWI